MAEYSIAKDYIANLISSFISNTHFTSGANGFGFGGSLITVNEVKASSFAKKGSAKVKDKRM